MKIKGIGSDFAYAPFRNENLLLFRSLRLAIKISSKHVYDIVIQQGTVIDGSGKPMFLADIALKEGVIVGIGDFSASSAEQVIDAGGCYVVPGFIDVNNHSDTYWELLAQPLLAGMLSQGVTTVIGGNSGSSLAPFTSPAVIRSIQKWTDIGRVNFNWLSMEGFLDEVERRRPGPNFGTLVGHGTLRRGVMRDESRPIRPEEINSMGKLLRTAMREGALGLSTGLVYTHARDTGVRELVQLTSTVRSMGGVYATYVRDEGAGLVKAVEEAISVARESGALLHISHLKAVGEKHWPLMDEVFHLIETASMNDQEVTFDVYPYTTTGSVLYTFLPKWITEGGRKMMMYRLRDRQVRQAVIRDMRKEAWDYTSMILFSSQMSRMTKRRHIAEIATEQGKSAEEVILDILLASDGRAIVSLEVLSQRNVDKAVVHPFSIISSNGVGYALEHKSTGDLVHPRNFGTFPKVLSEYVRERKLLSWEEAIHKMSGKPAAKFGLQNRGFLREGYAADVVVLRPDAIGSRATTEDPYRYPDGIEWVLVNGVAALAQGQLTKQRSGMVLRRERSWFHW